MPKSKHGKGKRYQVSKKRSIPGQNTVEAPAAATMAASKPAAVAPAVPISKATAATASVKTDRYAHVPGDLRRIALLTGVIIVVLILLRIVLP